MLKFQRVRYMESKLLNCHRLLVCAVWLCFGSVAGFAQANLFSNGSFEGGITGWTTQYGTGTITTQGNYKIAGSPAAAGFTSATNNVGVPTGGGTNALWVNGASGATTTNVVSQTLTGLTVGRQYTVSGWLVSAESPVSSAATVVIMAVSGSSNVVSSAFTATTSWSQIFYTFTAGATSATILFIDTNKNASGTGNDFGLDNLSVPEPATYAAGAFVVAAGFLGWRRHRRSLASRPRSDASATPDLPGPRA